MRVTVVAVLMLVLGSAAQAQSSPASDPFAIPRGPIACHQRVVTPRDSAASIIDMIDMASAEHPRSFMFAFDSAGTPRYGMITSQDLSDSTHQTEETIAARLAERVGGGRLRAINGEVDVTRMAGDTMPSLPNGGVMLSPDEISRTTVLARWVWERRCAANRTRPASPSIPPRP